MLEMTKIRAERDEIITALKKRNIDVTSIIDEILERDSEWRTAKTAMENITAQMNILAKKIGELMKEGRKEEVEDVKLEVANLKHQESLVKSIVIEHDSAITSLLYQIPNVPNSLVVAGKNEEDNETIEVVGEPAVLHKGAVPHWELTKKFDLIDFELGVKITGAGFPVYRGKGAKLQRALIQFFLEEAEKAGYEEFIVPHVVNEASAYGTGQLPDKEGQMYHMPVDDLYMIPTSEVPLTNVYRDVVLPDENFSIKMTSYTPCFRREAGSYGAHVRGLNRLHQFDKVEIVRIEHPKNTDRALTEMVNHVKGLLEKLGLHYRILRLCGGDTGFASAMTYDFEVFSAAQEKWLEVSSCSRFDTFQANRLKLRFKGSDKKNYLAHTLNGSALALPRIMASIMENYQTLDGIEIPEVLHKYTGFTRID